MTPDLSPETPLRLDHRKPAMTPLAYRVNDAAAMLGIHRATLWRYIAAGRLPARKLGPNVTVILAEDLERFRTGADRPPDRPPTRPDIGCSRLHPDATAFGASPKQFRPNALGVMRPTRYQKRRHATA